VYYAHFGLKQPPFKITPNTEFFFSGGDRGAVLDALVYAITTGEGIVKVVGEVGSGKTMLCRMLETLLPKNVESVYLANPSVAPEDVLHAIAFELHLEMPEGADRLHVMQALQHYLLQRHEQNYRVVIFIEEAQGMPLATLEEIRLLTNLETKHDKLLQIVLFGQPELDENLNANQIRQLRERITHSFNLGPLTPNEIGDYLIFRLRTAGYFGPQLFTKSAIRKIALASKGLVRRINILADKAMLAAFAENAYAVESKHVATAIQDSEFGGEGNRGVSIWRVAAILVLVLAAIGIGYGLHDLVPASRQTPVKTVAALTPQPQLPATHAATAPPASMPAAAVPAKMQQASDEGRPGAPASAPADILEARLQATQSWLSSHSGSTISIQLLSTDHPDLLHQRLKQLSAILEIDNLFVYRTQIGGRPSMTVLYGSFSDREAANRAIQQLPKSLRAYQPQLRTVGGVQEEIKRLQ
jgi:MSHA biogenesis protein MshM